MASTMMVGLSPALSGPNASAYILLSLCIVSTVRARHPPLWFFCHQPCLLHPINGSLCRDASPPPLATQGLLFCLRGYHYRAFVSFMCAAAIAGASAYFVLTLNIGSSRHCLEQLRDYNGGAFLLQLLCRRSCIFLSLSFLIFLHGFLPICLCSRIFAPLCQMPSPFRS